MEARINSPEELGALVRRRRTAHRLTQTQLAVVAGTTLRLVSEIERGKATVQLDTVMRVLGALGLELAAHSR
jgi:HTH-type transcriptional regulator / antitoxin HipB